MDRDPSRRLVKICTSRVVDVYARVAAKRVDTILGLNGVYDDDEELTSLGAPKLGAAPFLTLLFAFGLGSYDLWARDAPMLLAATRPSLYLEGRNALACMRAAIRVSLAHGVRGDLTLLRRFRSIEIHRRRKEPGGAMLARWCIVLKAEVAKLDESMRSTRVPGVSARASRDVRLVYCRYLDRVEALVERCRRAFPGDFKPEKIGRVELAGDGGDDGVGALDSGAFGDDDVACVVCLKAAFGAATDAALRDVDVISVCAAGGRVVRVDLSGVPGDLEAVLTLLRAALPALLGLVSADTIDVSQQGRLRKSRLEDPGKPLTKQTFDLTLPSHVDVNEAVDALLGRGDGGGAADADAGAGRAAFTFPTAPRPALDVDDEATLRKELARVLKELGAGGKPAEKSRLRSLRKMAVWPPPPELALPRRQPKPEPKPDPLNYAVREGGALVRYMIKLVSPVVAGVPALRGNPNPLPAGTVCVVVEKRESDGTTRCNIVRPFHGWVNLTDLVPLEGDDEA